MYHVPNNPNIQSSFASIFDACIQRGPGLGVSIGAIYGYYFTAIYGLLVAGIIGGIVGVVGSMILAIVIYCWQQLFQTHNLGLYHLYWFAPLSIVSIYSLVGYSLLSQQANLSEYFYQLLANVTVSNQLSRFVTWPSLIIIVTLVIGLPIILEKSQTP
ncbi:MAG TPA: hypothetical protein DEF47_12635 [Herpetosiphon sp.]|uniref:Uncharacterized protein n=1 Tax=Herpetosiphon aurantiacus (strain ATCC 23779 / DSM 785 / 114-95) TaxID=316274 RepID=A9AV83_HERA2|nr:hypothetical protein [Herpetosiphon sp.]ABX03161.1 hypothetical protein Haur_0512 [Herpetosiphon aurantiacus DSM 785]HBW50736.1 hypothetical protein [Herpetosiphon sp.]